MPRFRHELKFIISLDDAEELFEDALQYCDYDPHVTETKSYEIASIYYDTEHLRFYYDREESVGYRRKIRLRSYNKNREATALFIEIKEKHKQFVLKKRINLRSMDVLQEYPRNDRIPLDVVLNELEDTAEARELKYLEERLHLFPVVNIRYHRRPLIPKYEHDMRITLDTRITAGGTSLGAYNDKEEVPIIDPDKGVLEIKTNKAVPSWLQSMMKRYQIPISRYSKYCLGVDAIYGPGGKQWLKALDEIREESGDSNDNGKTASDENGSNGVESGVARSAVAV